MGHKWILAHFQIRLKMSRCAQERHRRFLREVMPGGRTDGPTPLGRRPPVEGQELGRLEEGVGSEDGGDNLPSSIDSAFAV